MRVLGLRTLGKGVVVMFAVIGVIASLQRLGGQAAAPLAGATINHIGFVTDDVVKARQFFIDNFGVDVPAPTEFGPLTVPKEIPGAAQSRVKLTSFKMGTITVEIIQPLRGPGPHYEFLRSHGVGLQHIGFTVPSLEKAMAPLQKKGVQRPLRGYADFMTPMGFMAEIQEPPK
jgi:methylmalonyl-CoA/ethylmalonyl-CoA epimerase